MRGRGLLLGMAPHHSAGAPPVTRTRAPVAAPALPTPGASARVGSAWLMPWTVALLRGQRVIARANADGSLAAEGGRVEIRYRKTDPRAYRAAVANLTIALGEALLADEEVVPGVEPAAKTAAAPAPERAAKGAGSAPVSQPTRTKDGWVAFTDGACSGNPGPAGSGMVIIHPGGRIDEGFEFLGIATNNVAELTGI